MRRASLLHRRRSRRWRACLGAGGALHPTHRALEHLADLARLQMPHRFPHEIASHLAIRPAEGDDVQMGIEPHVTRRALHDRHCATLRAFLSATALRIGREHCLDEETRQRPEELAIMREPPPPGRTGASAPIADGALGQHVLDKVRRRLVLCQLHIGELRRRTVARSHAAASVGLTQHLPGAQYAPSATIVKNVCWLPL